MVHDHIKSDVEVLQSQVKGRVITPQDADYDQVRQGHNLAINHHPALILVPANASDMVAGVRYARTTGLPVAVQTTGHGIPYPADRSLLIVTTGMRGVDLNVEAQTVKVEAGVIWQDILDVLIPHGLVPLLGSSPHVGVVGYTLAGGIGYLGRKYGYAADSVVGIDIVTADGELCHVSETENSDLLWGLRGGTGNFGVITNLEFKVYPVAQLYGGNMTYPGETAQDVFRFYRDWVKTLPDEMTTSIAILKFPNIQQMPPSIRGKTQVFIRGAYTGDLQEGERLIQQWLDWRTPDDNTFRVMPFSEVATIANDPVNPVATYATSNQFTEMTDEAIDIIIQRATDPATHIFANELRHIGGAISRMDADHSAISNRDAQFLHIIGTPVINMENFSAIQAHMKQTQALLQPYFSGGAYFNFMAGNEAEGRAKDVYGMAHYERLLALKAKYDPENVFRFTFPLVGEHAAKA